MRGQFRGYRQEAGRGARFDGRDLRRGAAARRLVALGRRAVLHPRRQVPADVDDRGAGELKRPPLRRLGPEETNYLRFRLSPDVTIALGARVKKPGEHMVSEPTELKVVHQTDGDEMDAYERLLGDAMAGDATLFARQDGVEAAWAIVEPILERRRRRCTSTSPAPGVRPTPRA